MDWTLGCNDASLTLWHRNNFAREKIRTGFSKPSLVSSISFPLALFPCLYKLKKQEHRREMLNAI